MSNEHVGVTLVGEQVDTSLSWSEAANVGSRVVLEDVRRPRVDMPVEPLGVRSPGTWHRSAACADQYDGVEFFPHRGENVDTPAVRRALALCARCPVRLPCLYESTEFEKHKGQFQGVRGGLTADRRFRLSREVTE